MAGAGIRPGDLLVADRAEEARTGDVVIAVVDGELTCKRLRLSPSGHPVLDAENPAYLSLNGERLTTVPGAA